jgi:hypothetical protein
MFVANYFGSILRLLDNVAFDFCVVCGKSMTNSTCKRPTLKTQVQAPELVFTGQKSAVGEQHPYKQTVNKHILFFPRIFLFFSPPSSSSALPQISHQHKEQRGSARVEASKKLMR